MSVDLYHLSLTGFHLASPYRVSNALVSGMGQDTQIRIVGGSLDPSFETARLGDEKQGSKWLTEVPMT